MRELGVFNLEKRRLQGDHIVDSQHLKGAYKIWIETYCKGRCPIPSDRTRENDFKLKEGRLRLAVRRKFFTVRVVRPWHRLPIGAGIAPSMEVFIWAGWDFEQPGPSGSCPYPWQRVGRR